MGSNAYQRTSSINLNLTDQNKRTVLAVAASEGHADIVQWLLDNGADGSICDRYGHNALHDAVRPVCAHICMYIN